MRMKLRFRKTLKHSSKRLPSFAVERSGKSWVELTSTLIELGGLIAVVITIIVTLHANSQNGKDTARAITEISAIAKSMDDEKGSIERQSAATRDAADASRDAARATAKAAKSAEQQSLSMRAQAEATKSSSLSTRELAKSSYAQVETLRFGDRPWVAMMLPSVAEPVKGAPWTISIPLTNTGRSPAFSVRAHALFTILLEKKPYYFSALLACKPPACQDTTIFPGQSLTVNQKYKSDVITDDFIKRLNGQVPYLFLQTRVDYKDNTGRPRKSIGCFYYLADVGFTNCSVGNMAD